MFYIDYTKENILAKSSLSIPSCKKKGRRITEKHNNNRNKRKD